MSAAKGKRVAVTLRMPPHLSAKIAAIAKAEGVPLNQWVTEKLEGSSAVPELKSPRARARGLLTKEHLEKT